MDPSRPAGAFPNGDYRAGNLTRRTGAGSCLQVDEEVLFREVQPVGPSRHPGNQAEVPASAKACLGRRRRKRRRPAPPPPAHRCWPRSVPPVASAPRLSGALPGSTSTSVINWVSVSTTIAALWPSKRRLLLLWPWRGSGSCTGIIRSRLTPSLRPIPSPVRSTVLEQQLSQQLRRRHDALAFRAALRQSLLRCCRATPPDNLGALELVRNEVEANNRRAVPSWRRHSMADARFTADERYQAGLRS